MTQCGYIIDYLTHVMSITWINFIIPYSIISNLPDQFNHIYHVSVVGEQHEGGHSSGNQYKYVILVLDGFCSHCCSWKSLHKMADAKIKVIKMPSHTSSALQPLDVVVFKLLKWLIFTTVQLAMLGEVMISVSGSRSYMGEGYCWPGRV